jgi:hypothetical protein
MNPGMFQTQLSAAWRMITELNLDGDRIWHPDYSLVGASRFRHMNYVETWRTCVQEQLYDFQLVDNSLIQFRVLNFSPLSASFAYYECPYQCFSYRDFLVDVGFEYEEVRDDLRVDYEVYLTTCDLKETVTPLRYDFSPELYTPGLHPASHMHFGYASHIRVGTKKILRPMSFLLFVLRQYYPQKWQEFISTAQAMILCRNVREHLDDVENAYWQSADEWEMSLL